MSTAEEVSPDEGIVPGLHLIAPEIPASAELAEDFLRLGKELFRISSDQLVSSMDLTPSRRWLLSGAIALNAELISDSLTPSKSPVEEVKRDPQTFWEGVEIDEPVRRKGLTRKWGVSALQQLAGKKITTTDLGWVLYAPEVTTTAKNVLQTRANTLVLGNLKTDDDLSENGYVLHEQIEKGVYLFICLPKEEKPDFDTARRPTQKELREVAVRLRTEENDRMLEAEELKRQIDATWEDFELEKWEAEWAAKAQIDKLLTRLEEREARMREEAKQQAALEIQAWEEQEEIWFQEDAALTETIRLRKSHNLSSLEQTNRGHASLSEFWQGVEVPVVKGWYGQAGDWDQETLEHFFERPLTSLDLVKVVFAERLASEFVQPLQSKVGYAVARSGRVWSRLRRKGLKVHTVQIVGASGYWYICAPHDKIIYPRDVDVSQQPSDAELRDFAIQLRRGKKSPLPIHPERDASSSVTVQQPQQKVRSSGPGESLPESVAQTKPPQQETAINVVGPRKVAKASVPEQRLVERPLDSKIVLRTYGIRFGKELVKHADFTQLQSLDAFEVPVQNQELLNKLKAKKLITRAQHEAAVTGLDGLVYASALRDEKCAKLLSSRENIEALTGGLRTEIEAHIERLKKARKAGV